VERRVLDAISGPSFLSAPSGKTYDRDHGGRSSTRLSTKQDRMAVTSSTDSVHLWITMWMTGPYPPIAYISILGNVEVAAERDSE
jgi:hypothetical protein